MGCKGLHIQAGSICPFTCIYKLLVFFLPHPWPAGQAIPGAPWFSLFPSDGPLLCPLEGCSLPTLYQGPLRGNMQRGRHPFAVSTHIISSPSIQPAWAFSSICRIPYRAIRLAEGALYSSRGCVGTWTAAHAVCLCPLVLFMRNPGCSRFTTATVYWCWASLNVRFPRSVQLAMDRSSSMVT